MKVRISNYSNAEDPIITIYKAYRLCYSPGEQSNIKLPTNEDGSINFDAINDFIIDKVRLGHTTPLEHVSFTFEINGVSRALTHQLVRHRTGKYNQQSQRYVKLGQFEYVIPPKIKEDEELKARFIEEMERDQKAYDFFVNKLIFNSIKKNFPIMVLFNDPEMTLNNFYINYKGLFKKYEKMAIEDARYVFSNACASNITATFDLNNLRKFYQLRNCKHAQWEIRQLAKLMGNLTSDIIPFAFDGAMNCNKICFECKNNNNN